MTPFLVGNDGNFHPPQKGKLPADQAYNWTDFVLILAWAVLGLVPLLSQAPGEKERQLFAWALTPSPRVTIPSLPLPWFGDHYNAQGLAGHFIWRSFTCIYTCIYQTQSFLKYVPSVLFNDGCGVLRLLWTFVMCKRGNKDTMVTDVL